METQTQDKLLKIPEVAETLAISVAELRRIIRAGAIPVVVLGPRMKRIERSALDSYIASRRTYGAL